MRRVLLITAILIIGLIALTQQRLYHIEGATWKQENLTYLPSTDKMKPFLLGYESVVAEYLWIRTVLYFGSHYSGDRSFASLIKMLDITTRLNPYFYPAYEFAGLLVADLCGDPAAARAILERGISHLGTQKWNLSFYMGILYYQYYGDRERAAWYFAQAAKVVGSPSIKLNKLAASFYSKAGKTEDAYEFYQIVVQTTDNPDVKKYAKLKIEELKSNLKISN